MVPEENEQTEVISDVTPLQAMAYELNEIYEALCKADFPERTAAFIIAIQMSDMLSNTMGESDMEFDEDDEDDWEEDPEAGSAD